ncbi:caspase family protein [Crocosphaera sp.]|uniref:caspase family protein n=1 Tax=Crocosphaera sp. TaxID=2729996 RepID=UPI00262B7AAD|nr:caspase family protein [Crocosphaera sp.]MDJ0581547.1 caspase family protein [Crocosphaera sp.]
MSCVKRRQFFKFFGGTLAALGLRKGIIESQAINYAKVLAQNTPRKRALLVGVNSYVDLEYEWSKLRGAINDTKLQEELLIHRFGFERNAILSLTDEAANRDNILRAFEEHLIQWAKPGDVVVFHFSGHGSQVRDPDMIFPNRRVSSIVPIDSDLPVGYPNKGGTVQDITGHTLWLLMQKIDTENITVVLDSCYSGGARKGILTLRSRPGDWELNRITNSKIELLASPQEQEYQKQLMSELNLSASTLAKARQKGVPKGVLLAAAKAEQAAIDASFGDTAAGVFTYVLTRYFWQQTGDKSVSRVMVNTNAATDRILKDYFPTVGLLQQPEFNVTQGSQNSQELVYFLRGSFTIPAEAVVTEVQGNEVNLFLGGIDPSTLEAFGQGATLTLVDESGQEKGEVQITSRQALTAKGTVIEAGGGITAGTLLQERVRVIPANLTLRIGLDSSLKTEQVIAKEELQKIKRIQGVGLDEDNIHYILGRVTRSYYQQLQQRNLSPLPAVDSLALFSPALDLIPGSSGISGENVTDGIKRLQGKLKSLLAARLIKLTLNTTSSRLNVVAAMETVEGSQLVAESFTVRGTKPSSFGQVRGVRGLTNTAQKVKAGTQIQFLIQNNESSPLYISVLLVSVDGTLAVLSPLPGTGDNPSVFPGETIYIPDYNRGDRYKFKVAGETGTAEVLVIASMTPLTKAVELLQVLAAERGDSLRGTPVDLIDPDEAIVSLLDDLGQESRGSGATVSKGVHNIDTRQMAGMSITFEVVS